MEVGGGAGTTAVGVAVGFEEPVGALDAIMDYDM